MKSLFKKQDLLEILKEGKFGTSNFKKAVEKAYISNKFKIYRVGKMIYFEQGSGRVAKVPMDIVEDAIGCEVQVDLRAA